MTCSINRELLLLKCLYFFEMSVVACLFIYSTPFMYEYGITASELAMINFIGHVIAFVTRPMFGYAADKYQRYKEILIVSAVICFLANLLQLFIPKHSFNEYFLLEDSMNSNHFIMCTSNISKISCWPSFHINCSRDSDVLILDAIPLISTNISCSNFNAFQVNSTINFKYSVLCNELFQNCSKSNMVSLQTTKISGITFSLTFWLFLICKILSHCFYSAKISLTDAITFVNLGKERAHEFGFTRMFGTIGILIFSIKTALVLHIFNLYKFENLYSITQFLPCFFLGLLMFLFIIITACFLSNDKPLHAEPFWKSLGWLFRNVEISVFFLFSIFGGFIFFVLIEYYFLIIFQMFPNLPKYFPGLLFAIMTISEAIFNGASSFILKFLNHEFWISFAFGAWAIRWLFYCFVKNYWLLILIEFLNGPAFGLMLPCMMNHVSKFASRTTQGRVQCLFAGLFFNIGGAFGALYGGIIIERYGHQNLFISMCIFSGMCAVIYYPLQKLIISKYNKIEIEMKNNSTEENNAVALLDTEKKELNI